MSYSVVIKRQILSILTKKNNLAFAGSLISIKVNDFSVICIRKIDHKSLLIMLEDLALSLTHNCTRSPIHCTYINFMQKKNKHVLPRRDMNMYILIQFTIHKTLHKTILHLYVHLYKTKTKALSDYKCGLICTRYICICIQMKEKCRYM